MPEPPGDRASAVQAALSVLSGKWRSELLLALRTAGPLGFSELEEAVEGISGKVLSENLEELEEAGIVDRIVVEESPLRVEYDLTEAGADLEPAVDALAEWGASYRRRRRSTVVIADQDRRLTELYRHWLAPDYDVRTAHGAEELRRALDPTVDVVIVDDGLPGAPHVDLPSLVRSVDPACRAVLLTGGRPDLDLVDRRVDAVVRKPTSREQLATTVETQLERHGEPAATREYHALSERRRTLEAVYPAGTLEGSEHYERLRSRLSDLAADLDVEAVDASGE